MRSLKIFEARRRKELCCFGADEEEGDAVDEDDKDMMEGMLAREVALRYAGRKRQCWGCVDGCADGDGRRGALGRRVVGGGESRLAESNVVLRRSANPRPPSLRHPLWSPSRGISRVGFRRAPPRFQVPVDLDSLLHVPALRLLIVFDVLDRAQFSSSSTLASLLTAYQRSERFSATLYALNQLLPRGLLCCLQIPTRTRSISSG